MFRRIASSPNFHFRLVHQHSHLIKMIVSLPFQTGSKKCLQRNKSHLITFHQLTVSNSNSSEKVLQLMQRWRDNKSQIKQVCGLLAVTGSRRVLLGRLEKETFGFTKILLLRKSCLSQTDKV